MNAGMYSRKLMLQEIIQMLDSMEDAAMDGNFDSVGEQIDKARKQYEKELLQEDKILIGFANMPIC